jgi:hypothetical protein
VVELRLPGEVLNLPFDGARAACQKKCHAPHRHAGHRQGKHLRIEVGALLIANGLELRGAEIRAARFTLVPRDRLVVVLGAPVAFLPIGVRQRVVVGRAGRVGTLRAWVLHTSKSTPIYPLLGYRKGLGADYAWAGWWLAGLVVPCSEAGRWIRRIRARLRS